MLTVHKQGLCQFATTITIISARTAQYRVLYCVSMQLFISSVYSLINTSFGPNDRNIFVIVGIGLTEHVHMHVPSAVSGDNVISI